MKKVILGLSILASIFTSCSSNDDNTTAQPQTGVITGEITANKTYAYGNYTLAGVVTIKSGVTVTFDAGSTITCDKAVGFNSLVVKNGGKLIVNGTADKPVVFTEKSKVPGSWGGIIMYGDAPIKAVGGAATSTSEDGNNMSYGGTNAAHNGGSLVYVRVEYAGAKLADGQKENNGFTFYSVGSGTTLDHLVAYKGGDDGFEFFGGTVSMTNAISYGNYDDAFDWQDGWAGQNNSNWYAYQTVKGNYGMEIEASLVNNTVWPKVSNITLKREANTAHEPNEGSQVDAIQFKREGNGEYNNIVVDGYTNYTEGTTTYLGSVVRIQDAGTNTDQVNTSKIKVTNVKVTNTTNMVPTAADATFTVAFPVGTFTTSDTATGATLTTGLWSTVDGVNLIR